MSSSSAAGGAGAASAAAATPGGAEAPSAAAHFAALPARFSFPQQEDAVLQLWRELDAFRTSLKLTEGKPEVRRCRGVALGRPPWGGVASGGM
jgi:hypothetical protein